MIIVNRTARILLTAVALVLAATLQPAGAAATATGFAAPALDPATAQVVMRVLVIATNSDDWGIATWKAVLDRTGTPYDVLTAQGTALTTASLVRADSVGRYEAILLTNNGLLHQDTTGAYVSAFDATEWNTLWDYERNYQVRQVSLYTAPTTYPEDYCLRPGTEGGVDSTPVDASLTTTGAQLFDYLNASAQIPISRSYVYRTSIAASCDATPLLTIGSDVVAVLSPSTDGRQRAALTFTSNQYLPQATLLTYGLLRWATEGVFVGENQHWINVDVDDWFNNGDEMTTSGTLQTDPGFRLSATDAQAADQEQQAARAAYPLLGNFTLNLPFNGADANLAALPDCDPNAPGPDPLTSETLCLKGDFRWINHTYDHTELDTTDYTTSYNQIVNNQQVSTQLGLSAPTTVLKTPGYSGLGVVPANSNDPITPPVDNGMGASNPNMLNAAQAAGVTYLEGNMSFASQRPSCWNCGIYNPVNPNLFVVPDWPTNIWYFSTTPDEETYFYNKYYGPGGLFPYWPTDLTYDQIIDQESSQALQQIMAGTAYTFTMHQDNLRQYAAGRSLVSDWLNAVAAKYSALYTVPLLNPQWTDLAAYAVDRTAHFAALAGGADAVWDRTTNTITYTPTTTGALFLTGATAAGATTTPYGTDTISRLPLAAGTADTLLATPRLGP
jgi:hypothetical protein